jgi:hypothetical protein
MASNTSMSRSNNTGGPVPIANAAAYQTAKGLAAAAQTMYNDLKAKIGGNASSAITALDQGFAKLKSAIDDKMSNDEIMGIVHGTIMNDLQTAFNLKLPGTEGGSSDGSTNMNTSGSSSGNVAGSNVPARFMMYATETSEKIHSDHRSGNVPISGPYSADTKYTLTSTGKATPISGSSTPEDVKLTLNLSPWKSTGRVLSMDIMGGTITVGQDNMKINSGQAYYVVNGHSLYAFALATPEGSNNSSMQLIRLKATLPEENNKLPVSNTDQPLKLEIVSPNGMLVSEWFLQMSGQIMLA